MTIRENKDRGNPNEDPDSRKGSSVSEGSSTSDDGSKNSDGMASEDDKK